MRRRRSQIDAAVFTVDGYLSLLGTGIRSLFDVLEARRGRGSLITRGSTRAVLFNQPFVTCRCTQSSRSASRATKVPGARTIFTVNPESVRED